MLAHHILHLVFLTLSFSIGQSTLRIDVIDDNYNRSDFVFLKVPNVTFCGGKELHLQFRWLSSFESITDLIDKLESEHNSTHVYLTRTNRFHTKLIRDFCQINNIPFINMNSYGSKTTTCSIATSSVQEYFIMPDILRVLINYLKYNHVQKATYIYDHNESTYRIYELLELMSQDVFYDTFSLDIRSTQNDDIYSILYNIESYPLYKDQLSRFVLLDLRSYVNYEKMFEKISHMGLTSDAYKYIIMSTLDVCLWMKKVNFNGDLIYFDFLQDDCILDPELSSNLNENLITSTVSKYYKSYYRTSLSFRKDSNSDKLSNSTITLIKTLPPILEDTKIKVNSCHGRINLDDKYISLANLKSQLPSALHIHSHSILNVISLISRMVTSNILDCRAYRMRNTRRKLVHCNFPYVNVFSTEKLSSNDLKNQVQLIGRYATASNTYQSCHIDKRRDAYLREKAFGSKIYYITSLFDEPFLMLRKGTELYEKYSQPKADITELRGQIFHFHEVEGYCVDLAERVCTMLNITCQFRVVEDGRFGSKNKSTGAWDGMVGDIVSRKADMAIAPLTISQIRMEAVDFSKPFMNLGISIMIYKPDVEKSGIFSFMNPVSMEIWLCLSLAYFAVSVVLFLTSRVVNSGWRRRVVRRPSYRSFSYPKSLNDRRKSAIELKRQKHDSNVSDNSGDIALVAKQVLKRRQHYRTRPRIGQSSNFDPDQIRKMKKSSKNTVQLFGISNALFFTFASFMRQSINLVPKSLSGRIAAISWWYFSLIFVSSYTANLVAFLTVENLVAPIESVEDLAKQQAIKYGSVRNGTTSAFFEKSNVSVFQHMWTIMQKSSAEVFVGSNDEGVAKVRASKGKYAFFIESTKNEYVNERSPCNTMKVGSDLDSKGYGVATRLGSDLTDSVDLIITNLRESGFLDKLKQRWWFDRSQCTQTTKDKRFSELSLSSVIGLFLIFLFGIILSCMIAFTEFLITAKTESETLKINFREILRIKMIENMVGLTINRQRQLEYAHIDNEVNYQYSEEEDEIIKQYTEYQLNKPQTNV